MLSALVATLGCSEPAQSDQVTLFFTANAMGNIEPCACGVPSGGLPRRARLIADSTGSAIPVLLDGGNLLGYPTPMGRLQTDYLLRGMDEMGYSVLGVGTREFGNGLDYLRRAEREHGFTFVCANAADPSSHEQLFEPWAVIRAGAGSVAGVPYGGLRVGVTSVLGQDHAPAFGGEDRSVEVGDPVAAVRQIVGNMRDECDLVVVLAHTNRSALDEILAIDGVDVVIACRLLRGTGGIGNVALVDGKVLCHTAYQARRIGYARITVDEAGRIVSATGDLVSLGPDVADDPAMARLVAEHGEAQRRLLRNGTDDESKPQDEQE